MFIWVIDHVGADRTQFRAIEVWKVVFARVVHLG